MRGRRAGEQRRAVAGQVRIAGADADRHLADDLERVAVEDADFAFDHRAHVQAVPRRVDDDGTVAEADAFAGDQSVGLQVENLEAPEAAHEEPIAIGIDAEAEPGAAAHVVARDLAERVEVDRVDEVPAHPFRDVKPVPAVVHGVRRQDVRAAERLQRHRFVPGVHEILARGVVEAARRAVEPYEEIAELARVEERVVRRVVGERIAE